MSESGWIQIITLLVATASGFVSMWIKYKVDSVHKELNSRLDQWREDSNKNTEQAIVAALARGKLEGKKENGN